MRTLNDCLLAEVLLNDRSSVRRRLAGCWPAPSNARLVVAKPTRTAGLTAHSYRCSELNKKDSSPADDAQFASSEPNRLIVAGSSSTANRDRALTRRVPFL